jgi:hypothetical protein
MVSCRDEAAVGSGGELNLGEIGVGEGLMRDPEMKGDFVFAT